MRLSVGDTKFGLLQNGQLPQSRVQKQTGALCFGELFRKQSLSTHAWSLVTEWCLRHNHLSCLGGVVQGLDGAGGGVIGGDAGGHCDFSLRKSYLLNCRNRTWSGDPHLFLQNAHHWFSQEETHRGLQSVCCSVPPRCQLSLSWHSQGKSSLILQYLENQFCEYNR